MQKPVLINPLRSDDLSSDELDQILTYSEKRNPDALILLNDLIESGWVGIDRVRKKHFKNLYIEMLKVNIALNGIEDKIEIDTDWSGINHFIVEAFAEKKHPFAMDTLGLIIDGGFFTRDDEIAPHCKTRLADALALYEEAAEAFYLDSIDQLLHVYRKRTKLRHHLPRLELLHSQAIAFQSMVDRIQDVVNAQRNALEVLAS